MSVPRSLSIPTQSANLSADLQQPTGAGGLVVFVHGSGSSRLSPRNQQVARYFNQRGLATLLFDLLTVEEHRVDEMTREFRFDIPRLSQRLIEVIDWLVYQPSLAPLQQGLFGASTGAAAALIAAAERPEVIDAVVSRGGRTDLAAPILPQVKAATLQIVGELDSVVLKLNQSVSQRLQCQQRLAVIPGATHLFEEPGTLEAAAREAADWFGRYL